DAFGAECRGHENLFLFGFACITQGAATRGATRTAPPTISSRPGVPNPSFAWATLDLHADHEAQAYNRESDC
ncbi:hypothetical protein, partial [Brevibacillus sp. SIMBA_040]|uniref:hypothetical protein n=1 Tax=Brevibacillus sp. SIMBA_040 TaxID=3085781 RepID=UPI00397A8E6B